MRRPVVDQFILAHNSRVTSHSEELIRPLYIHKVRYSRSIHHLIHHYLPLLIPIISACENGEEEEEGLEFTFRPPREEDEEGSSVASNSNVGGEEVHARRNIGPTSPDRASSLNPHADKFDLLQRALSRPDTDPEWARFVWDELAKTRPEDFPRRVASFIRLFFLS